MMMVITMIMITMIMIMIMIVIMIIMPMIMIRIIPGSPEHTCAPAPPVVRAAPEARGVLGIPSSRS